MSERDTITPQEFATGHRDLVMRAMMVAGPEERATVIEELAAALGLCIAVAAHGTPEAIDTLCEGAASHVHEVAVEKAAMGKLLATMGRLVAESRGGG